MNGSKFIKISAVTTSHKFVNTISDVQGSETELWLSTAKNKRLRLKNFSTREIIAWATSQPDMGQYITKALPQASNPGYSHLSQPLGRLFRSLAQGTRCLYHNRKKQLTAEHK